MFSKSHTVNSRIRERYGKLGSESLWKSLDEMDVLGHTHSRERTAYGHHGCVNALSWSPDGDLLISSGDDCRLLIWKHDPWFQKPDDRRDNVFSAQLLATSSPLVATCARDRTVRVFDLNRAGGTSTKDTGHGINEAGSDSMLRLLKCHTRQVKRVVTEQSQSLFLTVAGDHTVRQHDLRTPHTCPTGCPAPLIKVHYALNALALSSLTPWYFVVAGESKYGHLFDRRMVGRDIQNERGAGEGPIATNELATCVARFGRESSRDEHDHSPHVTGARMAQTNGHELLLCEPYLTYRVEPDPDDETVKPTRATQCVYQYSIYDSPSIRRQSSIIPPNDILNSKWLGPAEVATNSEDNPAQNTGSSDEGEEEEEEDEESEEDESESDEGSFIEGGDTSFVRPTRLQQPIIQPTKEYRGAANNRTVKDVNFLGPNDEFVASGSDDGNWFLWSKKTSELLGIWEGDGNVVNMVEGHPFLPIVAVSGIDHTVKIFEPSLQVKKMSRMSNIQRIVEENESANDTPEYALDSSMLAALRLLRSSGRLSEIEGEPDCPTQ